MYKMQDESHVKHANTSTEPSPIQQITKINSEYNKSKCINPSFSYLKHLPDQNFEVLKNVHL